MDRNLQMKTEKPKAIVLTDGLLGGPDAKTAHGLIRGTERFDILAVIDSRHAGKDAGQLLDDTHRNIPVLPDVPTAVAQLERIDYCIVGVATVGGAFPPHFPEILESCIREGISIVNGLHQFLTDRPETVALAEAHSVQLIDVRKPKPKADLHFWSGKIFSVTAPVIAVIGMDCSMGKRTTCRMVRQACTTAGLQAQMIYTGQTGWLQGGQYGFIFDSTLNDFISGELEHAIVSCWEETSPDLILLEGQSALRNPSGPCGSELLVSGNAKHVILVAAPQRKYYEDDPAWGPIPSVESEIALIAMYGAKVIAVALNTEHCSPEQARGYRDRYAKVLGIPVLLPLEEGVSDLLPVLRSLITQSVTRS